MRHGRVALTTIGLGLALGMLLTASAWAAGLRPVTGQRLVKSHRTFHGDVRTLPSAPQRPVRERPEREPPTGKLQPTGAPAPVGSGTSPTTEAPAPSPLSSFEGLHFTETCGAVQCGDGHPPDTNGDVGPAYYVETVNTAVGIYDKSTGSRVAGFSFNALMSQGQFGNLCDTDNFGDPVVLYDSFHDRWVITDFAFQLDATGGVVSPPGSYQCFAVSRTGDPVSGGWNFYSLHITDALQDYPKFGVWPDGLYMSANMFGFPASGSFKNVRVWALNLAQMEAGAPGPQTVSFDAPSKIAGIGVFTLLPSNARVQAGAPPAGRPNLFASVWSLTNRVRVWKFHVDWANTANSTFTGPTDSTTATAWAAPPDTVPSKSGNDLDTLAMRLMMQNQYTNIGGVESLWDTHTVQGSSSAQAAVRWYQVPVTGGTVGDALQAATWNPDAANRFMPSLAVDRGGDMAIGYSASSSTLFPAIRYAGRLAGDPVNSLPQSEASLIEGGGSQLGDCGGSACTRWGDYSAMTLDPDGCKFWYANEYYSVLGLDDHTRIGSFTLPGCTAIAMGALHGTVTDASNGNPIQGAVVTAGIQSTTTGVDGAYSFPNIPAATYGVTATGTGYADGSASGVTVSSGGTTTRDFTLTPTSPSAATKLAFTSSTASVASGATKTLTVEIRDSANNLVTSDNSTVVTFGQTSGAGSVTGLGTATASGGVATKTVTGATAGSVTITASASGLTSDTSSFSVTPGAASKVVFTSSTSSVTSGATKSLTVEVRDANNNLETSDNSTVVTFGKTAGTGSVTGLGTATSSGGVASKTVTGAAAGSVTITASASGLTSDSSIFTVTPGAASKVVFTSSTSSVDSGATKSLTVEVRDANNNLETSDNSTVVTFGQTSGAGSVTGLGTATASGGVATKTVTGATAGSVTITASASGLTSDTTAFTVTPGPADHLVFAAASDLASGSGADLTVELRDANDNLATSTAATVAFGQSGGSGTVSGLGASEPVAGVATKHITGVTAGPVTIEATAGGLAPASSAFTVVPGPADHVSFTGPTSDVASGAQRTLAAEVRDVNQNRVATSFTTITFTKLAGAGTVTGLPVSVTALAGTAATNVTGFVAGPITIQAAAPGLASGTTSLAIAPGPARRKVTLGRLGHKLSGKVSASSSACRAKVALRLQIRARGAKHWRTLKRLHSSRAGSFATRIARAARYRVTAPLAPGCAAASSKTLTVRRLT